MAVSKPKMVLKDTSLATNAKIDSWLAYLAKSKTKAIVICQGVRYKGYNPREYRLKVLSKIDFEMLINILTFIVVRGTNLLKEKGYDEESEKIRQALLAIVDTDSKLNFDALTLSRVGGAFPAELVCIKIMLMMNDDTKPFMQGILPADQAQELVNAGLPLSFQMPGLQSIIPKGTNMAKAYLEFTKKASVVFNTSEDNKAKVLKTTTNTLGTFGAYEKVEDVVAVFTQFGYSEMYAPIAKIAITARDSGKTEIPTI